MLSSLSTATGLCLEQNQHVTNALATMCNACLGMLKNQKFESRKTCVFVARAMVGALVLFDHVNVTGAFHHRSGIQVKDIVKLLKKVSAIPKRESVTLDGLNTC